LRRLPDEEGRRAAVMASPMARTKCGFSQSHRFWRQGRRRGHAVLQTAAGQRGRQGAKAARKLLGDGRDLLRSSKRQIFTHVSNSCWGRCAEGPHLSDLRGLFARAGSVGRGTEGSFLALWFESSSRTGGCEYFSDISLNRLSSFVPKRLLFPSRSRVLFVLTLPSISPGKWRSLGRGTGSKDHIHGERAADHGRGSPGVNRPTSHARP
jgi:hypothetical protein